MSEQHTTYLTYPVKTVKPAAYSVEFDTPHGRQLLKSNKLQYNQVECQVPN